MEHDRTAEANRSAGTSGLSRQLTEQLLQAAVAAPSMHNTQPWRFRVTDAGHVVELHADPARQLRYGDPSGRAMHIACGAALFNLRIAAEVAGWQPAVLLLPDPGTPLLLATVRFGGPSAAGDTERELHAAIERRHTSRQPFSNRPVPPGVLAELTEAASLEGAILHILDHNETVRVLQLVSDAERAQRADPAYGAELAQWVGGPRDRDGIPDTALGPRSPDSPTPVRDFTPGQQAGPVGYAWFETIPQLAVLSTRSGSTADWLRAGQALQRVLLTATARGIAATPLTQPLETGDAWLVRDPRSGSEQPQMILRIGYGLPTPAAPRRPVADVLDEPEPDDGPWPQGTPGQAD
jgi:nitroreductase